MPDIPIYLLNLIGSTESFVVLVLSFAVGRLLDAGFSRHLLGVGAVFVSLGMFMLSLSSGSGHRGEGNYSLIWVTQGLTQGLGMACFFVASSQSTYLIPNLDSCCAHIFSVASTWFIRRKSFAIGIVASGASIGKFPSELASTMTIVLKMVCSWSRLPYHDQISHYQSRLQQRRSSSRRACRCNVLGLILLRDSKPCPSSQQGVRIFVGQRSPLDRSKRLQKCDIQLVLRQHCLHVLWLLRYLFQSRRGEFVPCTTGNNLKLIFSQWAYHEKLGVKNSGGQLGNDFGRSPEPNASLRTWMYLSVMNAASTIGRMLSGWLSDHYGALTVHFIVMLVSSILVFIWWTLATSVGAAFGFVVVFGAVSGAVIGLPPATVANIISRSPGVDHSRLGQWTGMMYTMASPFALTGPVIAGYLIKRFDNFITVQMWSATCLFMASLCLLAAGISADRIEKRSSRFTGFFSSAVNSVWSKDEEKADSQAPTRVPSIRN